MGIEQNKELMKKFETMINTADDNISAEGMISILRGIGALGS